MIIGVPKEVKDEEFRVAMTPDGAAAVRNTGARVLIERTAGNGSGFPDKAYRAAGAELSDRRTLFRTADLIVKVKEPVLDEYALLQDGQALFAFLHLAPNPGLTELLLRKRITGLAYETLRRDDQLPLLAPMSEIAGRMAPLMGCYFLQKFLGGSGVLPAGASRIEPARAMILGSGTVGSNAAAVALGIGMETVLITKGSGEMRRAEERFGKNARVLQGSDRVIAEEVQRADLVVGAVLVPGGRTPVLVSREMLRTMRKGSVIVDVSVDQGGCFETSRPTTHADPTFVVEGIVHYCVANMPGAYPRTATLALANATLPFITTIAKEGVEGALEKEPALKAALNTYQGRVVNTALGGA